LGQDGEKITQKRIAEYMGMSARNLWRYKTGENLEFFIKYDEVIEEGITVKKLPGYQQIRATNKTIERLQSGKGGVVWHTQGSGKSLTRAYVTRKLRAPEYGFDNPTVMVMTDCKDLDRQITTTFQNVGFKNVNQASSVVHLDKLLRNDYGGIITTTLQKFQETDSESTSQTDQTELEEHGNLLVEKSINNKTLTKITKELQKGKWIEIERVEVELQKLSTCCLHRCCYSFH
jgi:type I restriction enzyme, R subunit